jgi:hypothetical protein
VLVMDCQIKEFMPDYDSTPSPTLLDDPESSVSSAATHVGAALSHYRSSYYSPLHPLKFGPDADKLHNHPGAPPFPTWPPVSSRGRLPRQRHDQDPRASFTASRTTPRALEPVTLALPAAFAVRRDKNNAVGYLSSWDPPSLVPGIGILS